jgi:hypothetical protein
MRREWFFLLISLLIITLSLTYISSQSSFSDDNLANDAYSDSQINLPIYFEANIGQVNAPDNDIQPEFVARGAGYTLFLSADKSVFTIQQPEASLSTLEMSLAGSNPTAQISGEEQQRAVSHYLASSDSRGYSNVPHYGRVRYQEVYDGIDLIYYGNQQQLQYDFVVAPNADPAAIRMDFDLLDNMELDSNGNLLLHVGGETMRQRKPLTYQMVDGEQLEVTSDFVLLGNNQVGFEVASYDTSLPLIIDPVIEYGTYLRDGIDEDSLGIIDIDTGDEDYVYILGVSDSLILLKVDTSVTGTESLVSVTIIDDNYSDYLSNYRPQHLLIDAQGDIYIAGYTQNQTYPVMVNGFQQEINLGTGAAYNNGTPYTDGFLMKLDHTGSTILYSTYIGGSGNDFANNNSSSMAIDSSGIVYMYGSGGYLFDDFPMTDNAYKNTVVESGTYLVKIDTTLSGAESLLYSSYVGPFYYSDGGIAVDGNDNVYISGHVGSLNPDLPVTDNAYQSSNDYSISGAGIYVIRIDTTIAGEDALIYGTFIGGSRDDNLTGIAADNKGNVYITGHTYSDDFPIVNGFQTSYAGKVYTIIFTPSVTETRYVQDAFLAKIDTNASSGSAALVYSTYLGGSEVDQGMEVMATRQGNVYVIGNTASLDFPLRNPLQNYSNLYQSASFITKIDTTQVGGNSLIFSSLIGNHPSIQILDSAVDSEGLAYIAGRASPWRGLYGDQPPVEPELPIENGFQTEFSGDADSYLLKIGFDADVEIQKSEYDVIIIPGQDKTFTFTIFNWGPEIVTGVEIRAHMPHGFVFVSAINPYGDCYEIEDSIVLCEAGNLLVGEHITIEITIALPKDLVEYPNSPTTTLASWSPTSMSDRPYSIISRSWNTTYDTANGVHVYRALAIPRGTTVYATANTDGVERDTNVQNNSVNLNMNALDNAKLITITNEQLYNAILDKIAGNNDVQDIEFVFPTTTANGINMIVRTVDGTVGNVLVTTNRGIGIVTIQFENITVGGKAAPADFTQSIHDELPSLLTDSLDALINQNAAFGYNLIRITSTDHGVEVIVEEP